MTVVKSFPAAVVYVFAITSMNDVIRDYDTSSLVYDLYLLLRVNTLACVPMYQVKPISDQHWPQIYYMALLDVGQSDRAQVYP